MITRQHPYRIIKIIMAGLLIFTIFVAADKKDINIRDNNSDKIIPHGLLYDSIKQKGSILRTAFKSDRSVIVANISEMTMRSSAIVVGKALNSRAYLTDSADDLYIVNQIMVQTVIKGDVLNGNILEMRTPGGAWSYSDGTRVSKMPSDARPVRPGEGYILFLAEKKLGDKYWTPTFGVQSVFEIDSDTISITPIDLLETDPVVMKYKNAFLKEFLEEIRSAAASE